MNAAEIKKSFRDLPADDQLRLLHELWDQLAANSSILELSAAQEAELERRYGEHEADPTSARTWEQVKADIRSRH
jgi:putative addiction module component (TIGR02574 family)